MHPVHIHQKHRISPKRKNIIFQKQSFLCFSRSTWSYLVRKVTPLIMHPFTIHHFGRWTPQKSKLIVSTQILGKNNPLCSLKRKSHLDFPKLLFHENNTYFCTGIASHYKQLLQLLRNPTGCNTKIIILGGKKMQRQNPAFAVGHCPVL